VIRRSFDREETGPYALGFPTRDVEMIDQRMIDRGFKRTLPTVNRYSLQLRDGTPYPITEASYEVADNTRLVVLSRGNGLPQNGTLDLVTGVGGPAYSSLIVENSAAMESFFTQVLDFERRTSREWSNFSPRFRYVTLHALGARTGNLGLVEYASEDRRAGMGVPPRPPNRGLAGWTFPVRSLSAILRRAEAYGATVQAGPTVVDDPRFGRVTAASLLAPNGFLIEVFETISR
jgi:catechol 2,3-dioxygenase-like lactoylglutathione lyase family enzyme